MSNTDLKASFQEMQITRDDKNTIPKIRRKDIPPFSVFFGETDIIYMDAGDYEGINYSVPLAKHVNKECMNYTIREKENNEFHIVGQVSDMEFEDVTPTRIRMEESVYGDAVYFPDETYPNGEHIPFLVLRHCFHGAHKFALSIGAGEHYGRLKRASLSDKALKIGKVTATITRV